MKSIPFRTTVHPPPADLSDGVEMAHFLPKGHSLEDVAGKISTVELLWP